MGSHVGLVRAYFDEPGIDHRLGRGRRIRERHPWGRTVPLRAAIGQFRRQQLAVHAGNRPNRT